MQKKPPPLPLCLILPGPPGFPVFYRATEAWHWETETKQRNFSDLKAKYPGPCNKLLCQFLDAEDNFVSHDQWKADRSNGEELKAVVGAINKVLKGLGYEGPEPIKNERSQGYRLLKEYVREPPTWIIGGPLGELPRLRWVADLIQHVKDSRWTQLGVLPGNGAEQVPAILSHGLGDDVRVINLDLSSINRPDDVLTVIAGSADAVNNLSSLSAGGDLNRIARAAAESYSHLVLVVENWGAFEQTKGRKSLAQLAGVLQGFKNVRNPTVTLVLLSPTRAHHLFPKGTSGSLLPLDSVFTINRDVEQIEKWAKARASGISQQLIDEALKAASGQVRAVQEILRAEGRTREELLRAINNVHDMSGRAILGSAVGSCCCEVLKGNSRASECLDVLVEANILEKRGDMYDPSVHRWTIAWKE